MGTLMWDQGTTLDGCPDPPTGRGTFEGYDIQIFRHVVEHCSWWLLYVSVFPYALSYCCSWQALKQLGVTLNVPRKNSPPMMHPVVKIV